MKIALDFDGTLADTMGALEDLAVQIVCPRFQVTEEDVRVRYRATAGDPFHLQLRGILDGDVEYGSEVSGFEMVSCSDHFNRSKRELTLFAKPFDDALDAVGELSGEHELHVVSSTDSGLIAAWLATQDLDQHTHRLGFDYGTKLMQLTMCEAELFVGDTDLDRVRADTRGIEFWGVCRDERLLCPDNRSGTTLAKLVEDLS